MLVLRRRVDWYRNTEEGGSVLLWNADTRVQDYTASYPRKYYEVNNLLLHFVECLKKSLK